MITADEAGKRLDAALADLGEYASRSAAVRAIEDGRVLVNGQPAKKKTVVAVGDAIVFELDEEVTRAGVEGTPIDLDIRFEDDDVIVLSKQVGLVCHPSVDHFDDTLVNALIWHCGADNLCNVQGEEDRLGIVHRLDRDTSGLMLAAKSDAAGYELMDQIRARSVDRHYLALVHGIIAHDTGMIDAPITRDPSDRLKMAVKDTPQARDAITTFKVLERFDAGQRDDGYTLVDCKLFTGRTHQIRVHMEYTHHPLVGEPVYDARAPKHQLAQLGLKRQFLHSFRIGFTHPISGEELTFADNLPEDLQEALDSLADRSRGRTQFGEEMFALLAESPVPSVIGEVPEM